MLTENRALVTGLLADKVAPTWDSFVRPMEDANERLRRNHGMVASFSRALLAGLSGQQSEAEFNAVLDRSIQSIFEASNT